MSYGGSVIFGMSYAGSVIFGMSYAGSVIFGMSYAGSVIFGMSYAGSAVFGKIPMHFIQQLKLIRIRQGIFKIKQVIQKHQFQRFIQNFVTENQNLFFNNLMTFQNDVMMLLHVLVGRSKITSLLNTSFPLKQPTSRQSQARKIVSLSLATQGFHYICIH